MRLAIALTLLATGCSPFLPAPRPATGAELAEAPSLGGCEADHTWHTVSVVAGGLLIAGSVGTGFAAVETNDGHNFTSTTLPLSDVGVGLAVGALASGVVSAVLAEQYVTDGCPALVGPLPYSRRGQ
jgi:hypothetical protein